MGTLLAPDALKEQLEIAGSRIKKERGSFLFRRGDEVSGVFFISQGVIRLRLERDLPGFPARRLGPGSVVGLPRTRTWEAFEVGCNSLPPRRCPLLAMLLVNSLYSLHDPIALGGVQRAPVGSRCRKSAEHIA
jgi:hypothetical protein